MTSIERTTYILNRSLISKRDNAESTGKALSLE